ncbi:MAG: hypothetical protein IPJ54_10205 [Saprospiraceae bacterium]|nr:hypothetical protein [Saprospiraceae bacterium]
MKATKHFFITQALHTNFLVGNIHDTQLSGLDGKSYMDKTQQNEKRTQQGLLTIDNEIDRIYLDTQQVLIHDHANQRVIKVKVMRHQRWWCGILGRKMQCHGRFAE